MIQLFLFTIATVTLHNVITTKAKCNKIDATYNKIGAKYIKVVTIKCNNFSKENNKCLGLLPTSFLTEQCTSEAQDTSSKPGEALNFSSFCSGCHLVCNCLNCVYLCDGHIITHLQNANNAKSNYFLITAITQVSSLFLTDITFEQHFATTASECVFWENPRIDS